MLPFIGISHLFLGTLIAWMLYVVAKHEFPINVTK